MKVFPTSIQYIGLHTFQDGQLRHQAREAVDQYVNSIRSRHASALFAVRSSALSEDSAQASFAGEFDTVLNVKTDQDVLICFDIQHRIEFSGEGSLSGILAQRG